MPTSLEKNLSLFINSGQSALLTQLNRGIEKEGLRVDASGRIAQSDHPKALGAPLTHDEITTDYSEALLELVTPVFGSSERLLDHLGNLHRFCFAHMGEEELWNASMPSDIPGEEAIRIAEYGNSNSGKLKHVYRMGLKYRYGKMMQTIAGIHYNFSMSDEFWPVFQQLCNSQETEQEFRSAAYFKQIRSMRRYSWLLLYLFGASPALCRSFLDGRDHGLEALDEDTLYLPYATSLRMSDLGYSNKAQAGLNICFNELDTYVNSLTEAIHTPHPDYEKIGVKVNGEYRQLNPNILQIENEYYSDVRPKRVIRSGEHPVHALKERGVQYIEVRNTDINPLLPVGIDLQQSRFMDAFLVTCLLSQDKALNPEDCRCISTNTNLIATRGREPGLKLRCIEGDKGVAERGREILDLISQTAEVMDTSCGDNRYSQAVKAQYAKLDNAELTPSAQVIAALKESGKSYQQWTLEQSRKHRSTLMQTPLDDALMNELNTRASASLELQREMEAADQLDFDTFLANYQAGI